MKTVERQFPRVINGYALKDAARDHFYHDALRHLMKDNSGFWNVVSWIWV